MSLIDEALKRAQEAHDKETGAARRRPWTPAPMPDSGGARRRLLAGAVLGAAAVALAAGGFVLLRRSAATRPAPPGSEHAAPPTPVPPTPTFLGEVRVAPPPRGVAAAPGPKPIPTDGQRPATQAAAPASSSRPSPGSAPPGASASTDRPGSLAPGKTYTGFVALPGGVRLELEGIVYSETNATAVINGRILSEGAGVEGYTVVRIEDSRVTLSGNGVTFYLALR